MALHTLLTTEESRVLREIAKDMDNAHTKLFDSFSQRIEDANEMIRAANSDIEDYNITLSNCEQAFDTLLGEVEDRLPTADILGPPNVLLLQKMRDMSTDGWGVASMLDELDNEPESPDSPWPYTTLDDLVGLDNKAREEAAKTVQETTFRGTSVKYDATTGHLHIATPDSTVVWALPSQNIGDIGVALVQLKTLIEEAK